MRINLHDVAHNPRGNFVRVCQRAHVAGACDH